MRVNCTQCDCRTGHAVRVQGFGLLCPHCFDLLNPGEEGEEGVQAADVAVERLHELRVLEMKRKLTCGCGNCERVLHASDCALHNAPALPPGFCDCGVTHWCQRCQQPFDGDEEPDGCRDPDCPERAEWSAAKCRVAAAMVAVVVPNEHRMDRHYARSGIYRACADELDALLSGGEK